MTRGERLPDIATAAFDMAEVEQLARELLPVEIYDFFAGGADDELTLHENVSAWNRLRLRPHTMRDVSVVDTSTEVLGSHVSAPIMVAPISFQKLAHPDGEAATAEGATRANSIMVVSTRTTVPLDQVSAVAPNAPRWFQLYILKDRGWTEEMVGRATALGYRALVLTVDAPIVGRRRRDENNSFVLSDRIRPAHLPAVSSPDSDVGLAPDLYSFGASTEHDPSVVPGDIAWLKELSRLPVVVKGLLRSDDAKECVDAGASGIAVSNHGGRQLDSVVPTAEALPEIVEAVGDRAEVYVDGGIRSGTDVLKAVALGATATMIGRPALWGLTIDGANGVARVLRGLGRQLEVAMALCGARQIEDLTPDLVTPAH